MSTANVELLERISKRWQFAENGITASEVTQVMRELPAVLGELRQLRQDVVVLFGQRVLGYMTPEEGERDTGRVMGTLSWADAATVPAVAAVLAQERRLWDIARVAVEERDLLLAMVEGRVPVPDDISDVQRAAMELVKPR